MFPPLLPDCLIEAVHQEPGHFAFANPLVSCTSIDVHNYLALHMRIPHTSCYLSSIDCGLHVGQIIDSGDVSDSREDAFRIVVIHDDIRPEWLFTFQVFEYMSCWAVGYMTDIPAHSQEKRAR